MVLMLLSLLLILAIAFYQTIQGVFSALVMALATLVCVLIGFNYYEPLADLFRAQLPAAADAVSLVALVALPLLGLRLLLDRFLGVNVVPHVWVDRACGGALGLITALLLVGTVLLAMQMLPFDRSIGGYDAYSDTLEPRGLFPYADDFVLGVVETLSAGSMSPINAAPQEVFGYTHDELKLELWGTRNRPHLASMVADPGDLQVLGLWDATDEPYPGKPAGTFGTEAPDYPSGTSMPSRVYVARVRVGASAVDRDGWYRLAGTQFRLVAADGTSFYPVGYLMIPTLQWEVKTAEIGKVAINKQVGLTEQTPPAVVDLLYRVPNASMTAPTRGLDFMAFRRVALAAMPEAVAGLPGKEEALGRPSVSYRTTMQISAAAAAAMPVEPDTLEVQATLPTAFRLYNVTGDQGKEVPYTNAIVQAYIRDGELYSGTVKGDVNAIEGGRDIRMAGRFYQPAGMTAVKLDFRVASRTWPDRAVNLNRVQAVLGGGRTVPAAGAWAIWTDEQGNRTPVTHLYYSAAQSPQDPVGPHLQSVWESLRSNLSQATGFGLIFLVPQGSVVNGVRIGNIELPCVDPLDVPRN